MTNKEKYQKLISHCMVPGSKHSYCNDLIKPYYLKDPNRKCAWYDDNGYVHVKDCNECKKGFSAWLKAEYDECQDPHWLDYWVH